MKLVFTADLHIGSAFTGENASLRNAELIGSLENILSYAKDIGAGALLLGGDLFDTPYPSAELTAKVRSVISESGIRILAVAGNHDPLLKCDFYKSPPENMFVFPAQITGVDICGVTVAGASVISDTDTRDVWQDFSYTGEFIALSHGELNGSGYIPISAQSLVKSGAALSLMGHIHKTGVTVLQNGRHALYCGTPAGRGFDECGERGFYVIDTEDFSYSFVKNNAKIYKEYKIDVDGASEIEQIIDRLAGVTVGGNEIARAVITGKINPALDMDVRGLQPLFPCFVEISDRTEPDIDIEKLMQEDTLEGEFVRILMSDKESEQNLIRDALKECIKALRGQKK